jgi:hypothetical protein
MTQLSCHSAKATTRHRLSRAANVAGALIAMAGFAGAPSVLAATTPHRLNAHLTGPSCNLASAKRVKSALGITVASPSVTKNRTVTVCQFRSKLGLLVRFETNESASLFAVGRKSFEKHGEATKTVNGLGTKAYSSSAGGFTTIVVLKNNTELLVTAKVSLAKIVALAKLILPSL